MFDEEELRAMSPAERTRLLRALAEIEAAGRYGRPVGPRARIARRRLATVTIIVVCCIALSVWTGVLAVTLPPYYRSGGWRGAWVGFDVALIAALAATGWAAWRGRRVLIICLIVLATLLLCDAWFDVVLDLRTPGFQVSLLSAILIELPLAGLAIAAARRLLQLTIGMAARDGPQAPPPPLWRIPLFAETQAEAFRGLFPDRGRERPDPARDPARRSAGRPLRECPDRDG